jgi:hypothetical protein
MATSAQTGEERSGRQRPEARINTVPGEAGGGGTEKEETPEPRKKEKNEPQHHHSDNTGS